MQPWDSYPRFSRPRNFKPAKILFFRSSLARCPAGEGKIDGAFFGCILVDFNHESFTNIDRKYSFLLKKSQPVTRLSEKNNMSNQWYTSRNKNLLENLNLLLASPRVTKRWTNQLVKQNTLSWNAKLKCSEVVVVEFWPIKGIYFFARASRGFAHNETQWPRRSVENERL